MNKIYLLRADCGSRYGGSENTSPRGSVGTRHVHMHMRVCVHVHLCAHVYMHVCACVDTHDKLKMWY